MDNSYVIVVGIDGSAAARRALHWALREAAQRGGSVRAVTVWHPVEGKDESAIRDRMYAMLRGEIDALTESERSGTPVTAEVIEGKPGQVLAEVACEADLLVLGSHGTGRAWHQLVGSVSEDCIRNSRCPVLVVPVPPEERHG